MLPESDDISNIYVDESSQTKHRFLVLGGLILSRGSVPKLESLIRSARMPELPEGELKWTKVSATKFAAYKRVVDVFFGGVHEFTKLDFHSVVIDTHKIDDKKYNDGSRETGFSKEIYQLLMKFGRLYSGLFHVYPDRRSTSSGTEELRLILNRGTAKRGDRRHWPFRRIHFRDSDKEPVLQLVDLLVGGLAYRLNGHHAAHNASPAKQALSDHILREARIADVGRDTSIKGRFTVWHRKLR